MAKLNKFRKVAEKEASSQTSHEEKGAKSEKKETHNKNKRKKG